METTIKEYLRYGFPIGIIISISVSFFLRGVVWGICLWLSTVFISDRLCNSTPAMTRCW